MNRRILKYALTTIISLLTVGMIFGFGSAAGRSVGYVRSVIDTISESFGEQLIEQSDRRQMMIDSLTSRQNIVDTTQIALPDTATVDTTAARRHEVVYENGIRRSRNFLDQVISGKNQDSLVYDVKDKKVYIYKQGDVNYGTMNMKADFMRINMDNKELLAYGQQADTATTEPTKPEFTDNGTTYSMDTVTYNIDSGKAKIKGVVTQDGEGYLTGQNVKKMADGAINISGGQYTTCEFTDHPHFYINMNKAKVIPGKKIISGYTYLVMEDVPIYFPGIPEAFFPISTTRETGFIMPSYGEEYVKGFFLRDGGYYFKFNDYVDLTLLGGIYTLGSWEASAASKYVKRYKYNGNFNLRYSKDIIGEKGASDYVNQSNFKVTWSHTQDPKSMNNSTFSASVNFSTSGYSKYGSTTLSDYLTSQTNSSIAYSKNWAGTPFSFSTNLQHSQNSRDTTISLSMPNIVFNMSRIYPFKRKIAIGKERWYEKISMSYKGTLANTVSTKENELFTSSTLDKMKTGVQHTIPVSASFNLFNYITISPSFNYNERWYFKKYERAWDPEKKSVINADTVNGFFRVYNYSAAISASTIIYGTYQFKGKNPLIKAMRHTITPTVSASWAPDFSKPRYGFYEPVQSDVAGNVTYYSPFSGAMYGVPGSGQTGALSFSLAQTLEAKVRSEADTSGMKKVKIIDNFSISGSYNLLADSMKLSTISLNLRISKIFKNFGINLSATLDPYEVDKSTGRRYNKLMWGRGKPGRIASTGWSGGWTLKSTDLYQPVVNDINSQYPEYANPFYFDPNDPIDPALRRQLMSGTYYDFDIPWNIGFNVSISYANNGIQKTVTKTFGYNGSINLTPKWGITFNGGYDFDAKQLTPGTWSLSRDLHCWQMNFTCVPFGQRKSWSFNISAKSTLLQDLKYDKSSSYYDNLYE